MLSALKTIFTHTLFLLPEFLPYLLGAAVFLLLISGGCFWMYRKRSLSFLGLLLLPYISIGLFIFVEYFLLYFTPKPFETLTISFVIYAVLGVWQIHRRRKDIVRLIVTRRLLQKDILVLLGTTLLASLMLFNFTYRNGIHDEYQHQAVIQLFLKNNTYPLINPLSPKLILNNQYHVGLYFPVILVKTLYNISIESALDVTKLALFLPVIPFLTAGLLHVFRVKKMWMANAIAIACLFSGPSLFFLDTFSSNVFLHTTFEQLYTPIFYELAGLTWLGLMFFFAYFFFFLTLLEKKKTRIDLLFIVYTFVSSIDLYLINRAFFITYVLSIGCYLGWLHLHTKLSKRKLTHALIIGMILTILPLFAAQLTSLHTIPLLSSIKPISSWGLPYQDNFTLKFAPIYQFFAIRRIGTMWVFALLLVIHRIRKAHNQDVWPLFFLTILPLFFGLTYFFRMGESSLALNKFLRPVFFWTTFICAYYGILKNKNKWIKIFSSFLLVSGIIPSLFFFLTANTWNIQRYWIPETREERELIAHIPETLPCTLIITNTIPTSYLVVNTSQTCAVVCPELSPMKCQTENAAQYIIYDRTLQETVYDEFALTHPIVFQNTKYVLIKQ